MEISVAYQFLPKEKSVRASQVMDHFGIGFETESHVIADRLELPIQPGDVVAFTGESGSGKSSLMRAASQQLESVIDLDQLIFEQKILVEEIGMDVEQSLPLLTSCGLGEAQLLLRMPSELSDGQQYRYRLAKGFASQSKWLVADEFTATLDRTLAKVIAYNVRRIARRTGRGVLIATTHDDILDNLQPDVHVKCLLGEPPVVEENRSRKKKESTLQTTCGSAMRPKPTGRISHGGIIEPTL